MTTVLWRTAKNCFEECLDDKAKGKDLHMATERYQEIGTREDVCAEAKQLRARSGCSEAEPERAAAGG